MRIAILVEGETEQAFMPKLRDFLKVHLHGRMPKLDPVAYDGRIPTGDKLQRVVTRLLDCGAQSADVVIALTDVYTGTREFVNAADAKNKMRQWVGVEPRFFPHVAQHDFESWLLPFWSDIQRLAGHNRAAPAGNPELVNHTRPPAYHLKDMYRTGAKGKAYVKPRDAGRILRDNDLLVAARACAELKDFLNTILEQCAALKINANGTDVEPIEEIKP